MEPPGFHTTARELQTCTFQGPGASKTQPKFHAKPQERRKNENCGGRGTKKAKFWAVQGGQVQGKGRSRGRGSGERPKNVEHQQAPPTNNKQQPRTTIRSDIDNNNKKCQNLETPKLAKCGFGQMRFWPNAVWPNVVMTPQHTPRGFLRDNPHPSSNSRMLGKTNRSLDSPDQDGIQATRCSRHR